MILKQYYLGCLAHASYLIGDEESRAAAVVDPQRDVDQYLEDAHRQGLQIRYVFLTHFHADFVAGHLELRHRTGAGIYLGARAQAEYECIPLKDGDVLEFGRVRLKILETPGHTPEGISILVYDLRQDDRRPHAVLTGDTLFIGDVGRPDLLASLGMTAPELAGMLYDSLHQKLLALPDETLVYPAHGAGSFCGRNLSSETVSTIGAQRRYNYALQPMSEEAFVHLVTTDQPEAPAYFAYDALRNRQERPTLEQSLERMRQPLSLDEVLRLQNAGAQVVDVRDPSDFAAAHVVDSLNIGLGGKYETWAGVLLRPEQPLVLIAKPGRETEAAMRLGRIGFDHVAGYLQGGMQAVMARPDLLRRTARITAEGLAAQLASPAPPLVLDVRTEQEWQGSRIEGSLNIPLHQLRDRLHDVPRGRRLVVHCQTGYRSAIAVSLLAQHGVTEAADLVGGIAAWEQAVSAYDLPRFVADLRAIAAETTEAGAIIGRVRPLAHCLALSKAWLQERHYECDAAQGFGVHLLHEDPDHTLAVFAIAWLPGRGAPPHNHGTWAVVAGVDGPEKNIFWRRLDDGSRPGFADIEKADERVFGPGEVVALLPDDIHSVVNETDRVTVSLHVYGKHLNYTGRSQFDPERKTEMPFIVKEQ